MAQAAGSVNRWGQCEQVLWPGAPHADEGG